MSRYSALVRRAVLIAALTIAISIITSAAAVMAGSLGIAAPQSSAQAVGPAFISINPEAGLPLDPFILSLQAGGPIEASTVAKGCTGYITKNPVVTIDYKGKADLLKMFFYSDGDPVLVIQTPEGKFVCNDNTNAALLDPLVMLTKPAAGRYAIWLGSAMARDLIPGFLVITGHGDVNPGGLELSSLVKRPAQVAVLPERTRLATAAARVKEALAAVKLAEKLTPGGGPLTAQVTAQGDLPAPELATGDTVCGGLITVAPTYAFDWSGQAKAIGVMFEGDGDTELIVRTPDGQFVCADDAAGNANLNPVALLSGSAVTDGRYLVWVGRANPEQPVTGKLTVAPTADLKPAVLKRKP